MEILYLALGVPGVIACWIAFLILQSMRRQEMLLDSMENNRMAKAREDAWKQS